MLYQVTLEAPGEGKQTMEIDAQSPLDLLYKLRARVLTWPKSTALRVMLVGDPAAAF